MTVDVAFNQEGVKAHNYLRHLHGCPPLKLSFDLASSAQAYADLLASENSFQHSGNPNVGENLAQQVGLPETMTATQVTLLWYDEIKNYNFSGQEQLCCGHFSQVIWKNTTSLGMGKALTPDGRTAIVVGQYQPPGNYIGEWGANVPPVVDGKSCTLTLEELTKGMNEDFGSDDKENIILRRQFENGSIQHSRKRSLSSQKKVGKPGIADFQGGQSIVTNNDYTKPRSPGKISKEPNVGNCKIQTKSKHPNFDTGRKVEIEDAKTRSKAERSNTHPKSLNNGSLVADGKPTKIGNEIILNSETDDAVVKRIRNSPYRNLHEIDLRAIGKALYVFQRPTDSRYNNSREQQHFPILSTSESGCHPEGIPTSLTDSANYGGKISKSDLFAINVFMELNHRRLASGLPPFTLSRTLDDLAREIAMDLKRGGSIGAPSGKWRGKVVHHYFESSYLFNKNASKFVQRCCESPLRLTVMNPNCKYLAVGCDFDRPFKKSVAIIIFA